MLQVFKDRFKEQEEKELGMGHTFICCCHNNDDDIPDITFTFQMKCCVNNINSDEVDGEDELNDNQLNKEEEEQQQQHASI